MRVLALVLVLVTLGRGADNLPPLHKNAVITDGKPYNTTYSDFGTYSKR